MSGKCQKRLKIKTLIVIKKIVRVKRNILKSKSTFEIWRIIDLLNIRKDYLFW